MHQMRLPKSDASIEKEWIEHGAVAFGHTPGRRVREIIRLANNESVKREIRIKGCAGQIQVDGEQWGWLVAWR